MTHHDTVSLGDIVSILYQEFLAIYGDQELASVATAATVADLLAERGVRAERTVEAA
jgi:hypothetical protein